MKVLGIGESVVDTVYLTHNEDAMDETSCEKHVGGPVLSAVILLSRLGIDCTLLTTIGRDKEAEIIKRTLRHEKVRLLAKVQKKTKIHSIIVNTKNGDRKKIRGEVIHPPIKEIDRKFLWQFDLIIIDRHEKLAFYEILKKKKSSTKIIIDPSTEISQFTLDMIRYADYPIIPIEALAKIDSRKNLRQCFDTLYTFCGKPVTITAGEFGSIIYDGQKMNVLPALLIKPVDVTGAGDIYRGGFAYGVLQQWDIQACASFGNLVAGIQCARMGNVAAIPTKEEIALFSRIFVEKKVINVATVTNYFANITHPGLSAFPLSSKRAPSSAPAPERG